MASGWALLLVRHSKSYTTLHHTRITLTNAALLSPSSAGYQVALSRLGLRDFVLHAPRVDLLSANREGVFGILGECRERRRLLAFGSPSTRCCAAGFLGIYMLGAGTGRLMARRYTHLSDWTTLLKLLLTLAGVAWMATAASHTFIEPVSRRMVRAPSSPAGARHPAW